MSPDTTRLLELGAQALRAEKIAQAEVDVNFYRDTLRNLATRIAAGEALDVPARQLTEAGQQLLTANGRRATWTNTTIATIIAGATADIQDDNG